VRNIGNSDAKFQLAVQEPFFVTPDSGRLAIGESMQIHVDFNALQTGDHASHMILQYETGITCIYYMHVRMSICFTSTPSLT